MNDLNARIEQISALPPLPESFTKIQQVANDPFSSIKEIAEVIQKDPLLQANILKFANSPVYGLKEHVNTIQQAISLFGISSIVGFAMAQAIQHTIPVDFSPYSITSSRFMEIATIQNALALAWKEGLSSAERDILLTSSFLMGIGSLLIADYLSRENLVADFQKALREHTLLEAETMLCGFTHLEISAAMFEAWGFDTQISDAIRKSGLDTIEDEISGRLAVITAALNLKENLSKESLSAASKRAGELGLNGEYFEQIAQKLNESI